MLSTAGASTPSFVSSILWQSYAGSDAFTDGVETDGAATGLVIVVWGFTSTSRPEWDSDREMRPWDHPSTDMLQSAKLPGVYLSKGGRLTGGHKYVQPLGVERWMFPRLSGS